MQDLPIGISEFPELRETNCVYIDKTEYVYSLLKKNRRTFLSRPRRFGKSLLVSTLNAALQGKKELFKDLWIADSDYSWEPVGVIRLDFSRLSIENKEEFKNSLLYMLEQIGEKYNIELAPGADLNSSLAALIQSLCDTNRPNHFPSVAVLIDEYNYPILHTLNKPELAVEIRNILKSFSCVIKAEAELVKFVFVTGVSAFSKSGLSSGLNNLDNITIDKRFFSICGYTDIEVDLYFKDHITDWAKSSKIPYDILRKQLKTWYNGYCFKENTPTIYSPYTFTLAISKQELQNFWFESATPQFLLHELRKEERKSELKLLELDQLEGSWDLLQTFEIENIPLPALLVQMGYLTIDTYNPLSRNYTLRYPNLEVRSSLNKHLLATVTKQTTTEINPIIGNIYQYLVEKKVDKIIECISTIISNIPYPLHIEEERYYHALLQTIFFATGADVESERFTSIGRMDLIIKVPYTTYIIELKINLPPEEGLKQIKSQKYYEPFLLTENTILGLGISFLRKKTIGNEKSAFEVTYVLEELKK